MLTYISIAIISYLLMRYNNKLARDNRQTKTRVINPVIILVVILVPVVNIVYSTVSVLISLVLYKTNWTKNFEF